MKTGCCEVAQKSRGLPNKKTQAPRDSSRPPFCPKWVDRSQNSLKVVTPRPAHVYRIWSGSAAFCLTYSGKIDFSAQKVNTIKISAYNNTNSLSVIPLSHLCGLSTVARGSRVYGLPQVFRGPWTNFLRYDHGDLAVPAVWCVSGSGASSTVQCYPIDTDDKR